MSLSDVRRIRAPGASLRGRVRRRPRSAAGANAALRLGRRDRRILLCFIAPALGWLAFAQAYPLGYSLYLSFERWSLTTSESPQGFAGWSNFTSTLGDPQFLHALRLSVLFMASVPIELAIGFVLALCTIGETRRIRVARTVLLIPMVIAPIAVGTMWRLLLDSHAGVVDILLRAVHLPAPDWLGGQSSAVVAVIGTDVWEWVPFSMIIYTAAMSGISQELLESANVDGASRWQIARQIILPLTLPATLLICVFRLIDAFLVIDIVYSLTFGGPGFATNTATLWVYNHGLRYFDISQAAAASWLLLAICVVIAAVVLRFKQQAERRIGGG